MSPDDFEQQRKYLQGVAYRMLGTLGEAEDAVQEAWLRVAGGDSAPIQHPRAFLTKVVTRICLDMMKSAHARRMTYVGPWLPEALHDISDFTGARAQDTPGDLADDLSMGLLYALERLTPLERASFLLHDVFGVGFDEIAETLQRSPDSVRQLASRARQHVRQSRPRFKPGPDDERRYLEAFIQASQTGDVAALELLLAEDVRLYADGGGKVQASINILEGRRRVGAFMAGIYAKFRNHTTESLSFERVNGVLSLITRQTGGLSDVISLDIADGRISAIYIQRNPDKLHRIVQ